MEEKEFNTTFAIPANYTDSGKIFGGMLEPRNAVEALILILAIGYPELMLIPMATTILHRCDDRHADSNRDFRRYGH